MSSEMDAGWNVSYGATGTISYSPQTKPTAGRISSTSLSNTISSPGSLNSNINSYRTSFDLGKFQGITKPDSNFSWSTTEIDVEDVPADDINVTPLAMQSYDTLPEQYTGTMSLPNDNSVHYSGTHTRSKRVVLPTPPSVNLVVFSKDVPEFTLQNPDPVINWVYDQYTSDLLDILKDRSDSLLTETLPIDTAGAIARDNQIWDSEQMFLRARGIGSLSARFTTERSLYRMNITRMLAILQADTGDKNERLYITSRQSIEDFERKMYDARKEGELAFAKAYADNRINVCKNLVEVYNQQLNTFRMRSMSYENEIADQRSKLKIYRAQLQAQQVKGEINEVLMADFKAQVDIVNATAKAYALEMAVSEAVANITLAKTELERLNTESFIIRTKALTKQKETEMYYKETEIKKFELMDAEYEHSKVVLEESAIALEENIASINHEIQQEKIESGYDDINKIYTLLLRQANLYQAIADAELEALESKAEGDRSNMSRAIDRSYVKRDALEAKLNAEIEATNADLGRAGLLAWKDSGLKNAGDAMGWMNMHLSEIEAVNRESAADQTLAVAHAFTDNT